MRKDVKKDSVRRSPAACIHYLLQQPTDTSSRCHLHQDGTAVSACRKAFLIAKLENIAHLSNLYLTLEYRTCLVKWNLEVCPGLNMRQY